MQDVIDASYAHLYAWNEIGFGVPAYLRSYMYLEADSNRGKSKSRITNRKRPEQLSGVYRVRRP